MVSNSYPHSEIDSTLFFLFTTPLNLFFPKVSNNHIPKSNGQILVILFDLSAAFDTFCQSVIEICSSLCFQDTIFLFSNCLTGYCFSVSGWFLIHDLSKVELQPSPCMSYFVSILMWWSHLDLMDQNTIYIQRLPSEIQHCISSHIPAIST